MVQMPSRTISCHVAASSVKPILVISSDRMPASNSSRHLTADKPIHTPTQGCILTMDCAEGSTQASADNTHIAMGSMHGTRWCEQIRPPFWSSTLSTFYSLYLLLSLPSTVSTFYCLHLLLPLPSTFSTFYSLYLLLSLPSTVSTFYCLHLLLSLHYSC